MSRAHASDSCLLTSGCAPRLAAPRCWDLTSSPRCSEHSISQAFLCVDGSFVTRFNDTLISTVKMRWNASYANYAECDDIEGGKCIFGDGLGVGVGRINPFYWPGKVSSPDV